MGMPGRVDPSLEDTSRGFGDALSIGEAGGFIQGLELFNALI